MSTLFKDLSPYEIHCLIHHHVVILSSVLFPSHTSQFVVFITSSLNFTVAWYSYRVT